MRIKTTLRICLLSFALLVFSCDDGDSYILKGKITGLQNPELYIVSGIELRVDTILSRSGGFTFRGDSKTVEPLLIYMENGSAWITLWVKNGEKFTLTGDANYPELIMVKGGEINKSLSDFKNDNLLFIKEKYEIQDKLSISVDHSHELGQGINRTHLSSQLKNVDQILKSQAQDFVKANPSSIAALVIIQDYILDIENASGIQPLLDILDEELRISPLYEKLYARSLKDKQTKSGQPALDFRIENTKNDTVSLETFKAKYLVLTFAASRCEFCKPDYPELLAIKNNFPDKELAILTVSLDENKEDWKRLAKEYEIDWMQAIDNSGWASEIASLYNVQSVPCNYLIDKEGIIIGSKLSVDSIQSILSEKLKKTKTAKM